MTNSPLLASQEDVTAYLATGLALASYQPVTSKLIAAASGCLTHFAGSEVGLPAPGFVYDWLHLLMTDEETIRPCGPQPDTLPHHVRRNYDDYVLARLANDDAFGRIRDVLRKRRRDERTRCSVSLFHQLVARLGPVGIDVPPTWVIRGVRQMAASADGFRSRTSAAVTAALVAAYTRLIDAFRNAGQIITDDDVLEIEDTSYLWTPADRLTFAQVAAARSELNRSAKVRESTRKQRHRQVPTHLRSEDVYPVGGYQSLTFRGPIESLASSQLAYMEDGERPDLFDAKYIRNELLYYSRDEGVFFRPPRSFVFAFFDDLCWARFKSPADRYERTIWALALALAACDQLLASLAREKLSFEFVLVGGSRDERLSLEQRVLRRALAPLPLARLASRTDCDTPEQLWEHLEELGTRTDCCYLGIGFAPPLCDVENIQPARLVLGESSAALVCGPNSESMPIDGEWIDALATLLQQWV